MTLFIFFSFPYSNSNLPCVCVCVTVCVSSYALSMAGQFVTYGICLAGVRINHKHLCQERVSNLKFDLGTSHYCHTNMLGL